MGRTVQLSPCESCYYVATPAAEGSLTVPLTSLMIEAAVTLVGVTDERMERDVEAINAKDCPKGSKRSRADCPRATAFSALFKGYLEDATQREG